MGKEGTENSSNSDEDIASKGVNEDEKIESERSYHSLYNSSGSDDDDQDEGFEGEFYEVDKDDPVIEIGSKFDDVYHYRRALEHFAILGEFSINYIKSDPGRVTARCASKDCPWRVHASRLPEEGAFQVKTMQKEHLCSSINKSGNKMATKYWVADRVIEWLRNEGELAPSELRRRLVEKYHVELPYHRVWRGKEIAMSIIHGCWDNSYLKIMSFKEELVRRNHGTIVKLDKFQQDDGWHFRRIFISISTCSIGFLTGCRLFLGLDGCHLKGKFKGVMLTATAIDGANRLFPVAYGVAESENIESWSWFLNGLYEAIGMPNGLVLTSNRQKGLEEAISKIYPLVEHRTCVRHLYKNFKKKFVGNVLQKIVWIAASSFTTTTYNASLEELEVVNMKAYEWFLDLERKHEIWSRSQFGTIAKCHYITNNISESFNAWVADARARPLLDLLDIV
ncbi:hypothetical protein J5N97_020376 [Dioscorea zingiberensis]|uniref:Transposase n=1 Tax=Dioscorea zingiberensis TaxID=325984 RepID=A0A9D5CGX3_9LILI|nr:hypothetical protein J5N97_020376 [Dioscorea zingiberensis]